MKDALSQVIYTGGAFVPAKRAIVVTFDLSFLDHFLNLLDTLKRFDKSGAEIVAFYVDDALRCSSAVGTTVATIKKSQRKCGVMSFERLGGGRGNWISNASLLAPDILKDAETFLLLEADMLCMGDLAPLFEQIEAAPDDHLFGVCPRYDIHSYPMGPHIDFIGGDWKKDTFFLFGEERNDMIFHFNGGLLGGKASAIRRVHQNLASLYPWSVLWMSGMMRHYGDELLRNMAICMGGLKPVQVSLRYNHQVYPKYSCPVEQEHYYGYAMTPDGPTWRAMGETEPTVLLHGLAGDMPAGCDSRDRRRVLKHAMQQLNLWQNNQDQVREASPASPG